MNDEWDEKYEKPVVERKIVGFSGIDPSRKQMSPEQEKEVERIVGEKVEEHVEEVVNNVVEIRIGD